MLPIDTDSFTALVLHVLAHVRAPGPADLFDARYVAWAAAIMPDELGEPLHADAAMIAERLSAPDALALQAWPELHRDGSFALVRGRELVDVQPDEVASPAVRAALLRCDRIVVELVHAQLALLWPWFSAMHAEVVAPSIAAARPAVVHALADAIAIAPSLAQERVELAWSLGPRGRGFADRIVVGAPAPWHGLPAATTAVLALHEHEVRRATDRDHEGAEWSALVTLARAMDHATDALQRAHADWLASLDLGALLDALVATARLDVLAAKALRDRPHERTALLAAADPGA